jgi:membrane associated rhomboid family serine protease
VRGAGEPLSDDRSVDKLSDLWATNPGAAALFAVMVVASLVGLFIAPSIIERGVFRPYWLVRGREYPTLISNAFLHADLPHLLFNGFTYWAFAFPLERAIGTPRFLTLYAVGMLVSDIGTYVTHRHDASYRTLGASGAILAVLFASIVYAPASSIFILPIPVPIPAPVFAVLYLAYTYYASRQNRGRVNHDAHLSGALAGIAFVAVTDPEALARAARSVFG